MNEVIKRRIEAVKNGTAYKLQQPSDNVKSVIQLRLEEVKRKEEQGLIPPKEERLKAIKKPPKPTTLMDLVDKSLKGKEKKKVYNKIYHEKYKSLLKEKAIQKKKMIEKKLKNQ